MNMEKLKVPSLAALGHLLGPSVSLSVGSRKEEAFPEIIMTVEHVFRKL